MVGRSQAGSDQILGRCWAELVQELGADAGQGKILGRCLADAGAYAGQLLGRCWVDAGQLLGSCWPDAGHILKSILNLSALPVPMLSQVFPGREAGGLREALRDARISRWTLKVHPEGSLFFRFT